MCQQDSKAAILHYHEPVEIQNQYHTDTVYKKTYVTFHGHSNHKSAT